MIHRPTARRLAGAAGACFDQAYRNIWPKPIWLTNSFAEWQEMALPA